MASRPTPPKKEENIDYPEDDDDDDEIQMLFQDLSATVDSQGPSAAADAHRSKSLDFLGSDPVSLSLFHCTLCQTPFGDGDGLARHLLRRHDGAEADMTAYQLYFCQPCRYSFLDLDEVGRHAAKVHPGVDLRGSLVKVRIQRVERREENRGLTAGGDCGQDNEEEEEEEFFADQFLEQEMAEDSDGQEAADALSRNAAAAAATSANQAQSRGNRHANPNPNVASVSIGRSVLATPDGRSWRLQNGRQNFNSGQGFVVVSPSGLTYEDGDPPFKSAAVAASAAARAESARHPFENARWSSSSSDFLRRRDSAMDSASSHSQTSPTPTAEREGGGSRRDKNWHNHQERGRRLTLRAHFLELRSEVFGEPSCAACASLGESYCQSCQASSRRAPGSKVTILEGARSLALRLTRESAELETMRLGLSRVNSVLVARLRQYGIVEGMLKRSRGVDSLSEEDRSTRRSSMPGVYQAPAPPNKRPCHSRDDLPSSDGSSSSVSGSRLLQNRQLFHSVLRQQSSGEPDRLKTIGTGLWKDSKTMLLECHSGGGGGGSIADEDSDQDSICLVVDEDQRSEGEEDEETIYVIEED